MKKAPISIFLARQALTLTIIRWNNDIPNSIIPGLQCWYCHAWQAPYGLLWHIISLPGIVYPTTIGYVTYTNIVDFVAMNAITQYRRLSTIYQVCSVWIWLQAPYNLPILWMATLGLYRWPLTFLAPIAKLPVGASITAWRFVFSKPYNVNDYQYYALMGIVFVAVLVQRRLYPRQDKKDSHGSNRPEQPAHPQT